MAYKKISEITFPRDYTLENSGITQSLLSTWQCCPRRFLLSVCKYKYPKDSRPLVYGSFIHDILDKLYTTFSQNKIDYLGLNDLSLQIIKGYNFKDYGTIEEQEMLRATGMAVIEEYLKYYKKDFIEMRFEALEDDFKIEWYEILLRGKIDGRYRTKDGSIWNIEHKNYSQISENLQLKLSFDLQNLFYMLATKQKYGITLRGVLYNIIRSPQQQKNISPKNWYNYLKEKIQKDKYNFFIRYEIPYTVNDLGQFERELKAKINILTDAICSAQLDHTRTLGYFYKNECCCESPYKCQYLQACAQGHLNGYKKKERLFEELTV